MRMNITVDHELADAKKIFGCDSKIKAPILAAQNEHVPQADEHYHFDPVTTQAILAGFAHRKHVLVHGFHGTGKSTHIEQVAARLNWPLIRVNLDGHISRIDLIGRDVITLKGDKQVTEFQEGILPWALSRPCALLFDEYDAARPDVMFVLQRVLEASGKLTLLDQNRVLTPHPEFRLFATSNTIGLGDVTGMYHGTNPINQGQMDRWQIVTQLDYMAEADEVQMVAGHVDGVDAKRLRQMVVMAGLIRQGFANGDLSTIMSPRTVIHWADNLRIFGDLEQAFRYAYLNKSDASEHSIIAELYQRVFDEALPELVAVA